MKILYLHQYFTNFLGKGGTRSFSLAKELVDHGHKVHIVCINDSRSNTGLENSFINGKRTGFYEGIKITEFDINYSNHKNYFL